MDKVYIYGVKKGSIAEDIGLRKGEYILSINSEKITDILDWKFHNADSYVELEVEHSDGTVDIYEIEKDEDEDLGIEFKSELIDDPHTCYNNCIFCFMEQLPQNVRDTLVFKDDDYRLSFFTGNYITLTNMKKEDIERIIKYRLSPVNISVQATDEKVRCMMLNNRHAGKVLKYLKVLQEAEISMNTQIVLCKGINDGEVLKKTIEELSKHVPALKSICIVPVGLSKMREELNLYPLKPLEKEDCLEVCSLISKYQIEFKKKYNTRLVYLADEFYLKAGVDVPNFTDYEDFLQLENGVGMISLFEHDFKNELKKLKEDIKSEKVKIENRKTVTLITGKITEEYMTKKAKQIMKLIPFIKINVIAPINTYFGENITVTGLVTGVDIKNTINNLDIDLGEYVVIPGVMLKEDEDIFLDDTLLTNLQKAINKNIVVSVGSPRGFIDAILVNSDKKIHKMKAEKTYGSYENSKEM